MPFWSCVWQSGRTHDLWCPNCIVIWFTIIECTGCILKLYVYHNLSPLPIWWMPIVPLFPVCTYLPIPIYVYMHACNVSPSHTFACVSNFTIGHDHYLYNYSTELLPRVVLTMYRILDELIVSRFVAESITNDAGHFGHVGLCQLLTKAYVAEASCNQLLLILLRTCSKSFSLMSTRSNEPLQHLIHDMQKVSLRHYLYEAWVVR